MDIRSIGCPIIGILAEIGPNPGPALWVYCPIGYKYYNTMGGCQQLFKEESDLCVKLLTCTIIGLYEGLACYV